MAQLGLFDTTHAAPGTGVDKRQHKATSAATSDDADSPVADNCTARTTTPAATSKGADSERSRPTPAAPGTGADKQPNGATPTAPGNGADNKRSSIDDRFEMFCAANPHVFAELLRLARARLDRGETFISAKALWEELRVSLAKIEDGAYSKYKLNNSYTALYARALIAAEPKLAGVIKTRTRKNG